jgi:hypothetical protein
LFVQRRYGDFEKGPTVSHAHGTAHQGVTAEQDANSGLEARLAAGADGVIDDVYAAHGSAVLGYLRRFVPYDDAEDVLQRVFYEVWRHQGRYDPSRSLAAWIFGIARKRAIDHLRRQRGTSVPLDGVRGLVGEDGRDVAERYVQGSEVRNALSRYVRTVVLPHPSGAAVSTTSPARVYAATARAGAARNR